MGCGASKKTHTYAEGQEPQAGTDPKAKKANAKKEPPPKKEKALKAKKEPLPKKEKAPKAKKVNATAHPSGLVPFTLGELKMIKVEVLDAIFELAGAIINILKGINDVMVQIVVALRALILAVVTFI